MPWGVIFAWPVVSAEIYRLFSWLHLSDWANHYVSCDRSDKPRQYFPEQSYLHGALRDHYSKSGHWTRLLACCSTFSFLDAPQKNKLHFQWKVHSAQTVRNRKMAKKNVITYQIMVVFLIKFFCGGFFWCFLEQILFHFPDNAVPYGRREKQTNTSLFFLFNNAGFLWI